MTSAPSLARLGGASDRASGRFVRLLGEEGGVKRFWLYFFWCFRYFCFFFILWCVLMFSVFLLCVFFYTLGNFNYRFFVLFFIFHFLDRGVIFPFLCRTRLCRTPSPPDPPLAGRPSARPRTSKISLFFSLPTLLHMWALWTSCETPAALGRRPGLHKMSRELQICVLNDEIAQRQPQFHERPRKWEKTKKTKKGTKE